MRAYPFPYLALMVLGVVGVAFILVSLGSQAQAVMPLQEAASYFGLIPVIFVAMGLVSLIFWILALVHLLRNPALEGTEKLVWVLVVVFLNTLGAVLYFFIAPDPRARLSEHSAENLPAA